jgi:biofilm protein TabA
MLACGMITDTLAQYHRYLNLSPRFAAAFEFLAKLPADQPTVRYDIDGNNCFALVQSYTSKPLNQAAFEAHQIYTDIQYIQSGKESILWAPVSTLKVVTKPYVPEKDIAFFGNPAAYTSINLLPGSFTIFFPEDGHAPGVEFGGPTTVRKVVIKVKV